MGLKFYTLSLLNGISFLVFQTKLLWSWDVCINFKKYLNTLEVGSIFLQTITESLNIFNFIV